MHAQSSICLEHFNGGQNHEVAWTPRAGSSLRVHGHVSEGTISDVVPFLFFFFFYSHPLILPPTRVRRESSHSLAVLKINSHLLMRPLSWALWGPGVLGHTCRVAQLCGCQSPHDLCKNGTFWNCSVHNLCNCMCDPVKQHFSCICF